jgi:anti-sigma factor ChrR (cupin superfamily)
VGGLEIGDDDLLAELFAEPGADAILTALTDDLEPMAPRAAVREGILAATSPRGRLARFADKLAALVDLPIARAKELLERVSDESLWERDLFPGLEARWVEGGPAVTQCVRGFARLGAGEAFPVHQHLGDETTLVLEGAMIESGGHVIRPGETYTMSGDSEHSYRAAPGGTDLLFFVVIRGGLAFEDGSELKSRD